MGNFWTYLTGAGKSENLTEVPTQSEMDKVLETHMNFFKSNAGIDWAIVEKTSKFPEGIEIKQFIQELEDSIKQAGRITAFPARKKKLLKLMKQIDPDMAIAPSQTVYVQKYTTVQDNSLSKKLDELEKRVAELEAKDR